MNKRDLKADLKFCDRATQGPWRHEWNSDYSEVYAPGFDNPIILVGHDPYDADFIVQAREGWPHAIERAIKAEALARELVEALKKADQFITNGVEFGYIRLPDSDTQDSAIETPGTVRKVLAKAKEVLGDD